MDSNGSNNPLISVVVPMYNAEQTIGQTVASALSQTYPAVEVIVVDDGSSDASLEVARRFEGERVRVYSYANGGPAACRNRGIGHAVGSLVAFLDADDHWSADKLAAQKAAMDGEAGFAAAYSWTTYVDEGGHVLHGGLRARASGNVYRQMLLTNLLESGSNLLVRRSALTECGLFDESPLLRGAEDHDLNIRLARLFDFACVPRHHVFYRQTSGSVSGNLQRQERACLAMIGKAFSTAPSSLQYLRARSEARLLRYLGSRALASTHPQAGRQALSYLRRAILADRGLLLQRNTWGLLVRSLLRILSSGPAVALPGPWPSGRRAHLELTGQAS